MISRRRWTEQENKFLIDNFNRLTNREISANLNRTVDSIKSRFKFLDLINRNEDVRRKANSIYSVNLSYFDVITKESSYWAGFIAADGFVSPSKNTLSICLSSKDKDHLERFKNDIGSTAPIKDIVVKPSRLVKTESKAVRLDIHACKQIIKALQSNFSIVPKKTNILESPKLDSSEDILSYFVGYIDGDGCIYRYKNNAITCSITGGKGILDYFKSIIDFKYPVKNPALVRKATKGNYYDYQFTGSRLLSFYNDIKSFDLPKMYRKWNKFIEVYNEKV